MWRIPFHTLPEHLQSRVLDWARQIHHSNRAAESWAVHQWWRLTEDRKVMMGDSTPALHFVGFRGEELHSAIRIWGQPDFFHRVNDRRVRTDVAPGDTVVFANGEEAKDREFTWNDSERF